MDYGRGIARYLGIIDDIYCGSVSATDLLTRFFRFNYLRFERMILWFRISKYRRPAF